MSVLGTLRSARVRLPTRFAGLVIGVMVLAWRHWLPLLAAVGFGASTLVAFVISATVGLFGVHETWTGGAVLTAAASELATVVFGVAAGAQELLPRLASRRQPQDRLAGSRPDLH